MSQDQLSDMRTRRLYDFSRTNGCLRPVYKVYQIAETVVRHLGTSFEDALARAKEQICSSSDTISKKSFISLSS